MKIQDAFYLPGSDALTRQLDSVLRAIGQQVNQLSEGRIVARYNATTAAPTTGSHAQGDFVANSAPRVLGTAGSQFVIAGWPCPAAGAPGTLGEQRGLHGTGSTSAPRSAERRV